MRNRLPLGLLVATAFQFIGPLLLPPDTIRGIGPDVWDAIVALFLVLGVYLVLRRAWGRAATISVQGVSFIVRVLYLICHGVQPDDEGRVLNVETVATSHVSILVSGAILCFVGLPDVQALVQ